MQPLPPAFCAQLLALAAIGDMLGDDATITAYLATADGIAIDAAMGDDAARRKADADVDRCYRFGVALLQERGMTLEAIHTEVSRRVQAIQADPAGHVGAAMTRAIRRVERGIDANAVAAVLARWQSFQASTVQGSPLVPVDAPATDWDRFRAKAESLSTVDFPNLTTRNRGPNLA